MMNQFLRQEAAAGPAYQSEVYFPIDISSEQDGFRITALLPGIKGEDLNVQVINETVSIQGELALSPAENTDLLLKEIPTGRFSRVLTLPASLDADKVDASLENGVLSLWIPKAESARPRQIKVVHNN
jgi:HSP20 family protein